MCAPKSLAVPETGPGIIVKSASQQFVSDEADRELIYGPQPLHCFAEEEVKCWVLHNFL